MSRCRLASFVALVSLIMAGSAQADSFAWYGELVSVDRGGGTITVRVQSRPSAIAFVQRAKPGDPLVFIWERARRAGADAQTLLAAAAPQQVKFIGGGYLTRAEFVSVDASAETVTFTVRIPPASAKAVSAFQPGQWIKVTAPLVQPGPDPVPIAIAGAEKPVPEMKIATAPQPTPPRQAPDPVKPNGGISGKWEIRYKDQLSTSHYLACDLAQDGARIGGSCDDPGRGRSPVSGSAAGGRLELQIPPGGTVYSGTLHPDGTIIRGTVGYLGVELRFEATRTP